MCIWSFRICMNIGLSMWVFLVFFLWGMGDTWTFPTPDREDTKTVTRITVLHIYRYTTYWCPLYTAQEWQNSFCHFHWLGLRNNHAAVQHGKRKWVRTNKIPHDHFCMLLCCLWSDADRYFAQNWNRFYAVGGGIRWIRQRYKRDR
jgi:hypothetical protein